MKDICYLVVNARGIVRLTHNRPAMAGGECAVKLRVEIADTIFNRLTPDIAINIPADKIVQPQATVSVEA